MHTVLQPENEERHLDCESLKSHEYNLFVGENLDLLFFLSCKFSEDGQQLFAIAETKSFQIYNIHDSTVKLVAEEDTILLSALLESTGIGK
jgi:hypothetical protein